MRGHIISSERDRYKVLILPQETGQRAEIVLAQARGVFRDKAITPIVGDFVILEPVDAAHESYEATITAIEPRRNALVRPAVANVDQVLVVQTVIEPAINPLTFDKLLVVLEKRGLPIVICFNKSDRVTADVMAVWKSRYEKAGYPVVITAAALCEGLPELQAHLQGRTTAIAGPSGAGKSTIIHALTGDDAAEVGGLSRKTDRGKQTTRRINLFAIDEQTFIFDTPGFSSMDMRDFSDPMALQDCFPEIAKHRRDCKFRDCIHRREPGCAVRAAVERGEIDRERLNSYHALFDEIVNHRHY